MKYRILSVKNTEEWNNIIHKLPLQEQDIYFTPEYYFLYEQNQEGIAQCFVFENENGLAIYPFLKNEINNLGFNLENTYYDIQGAYGYNGIISSNHNQDFINQFFNAFSEYCSSENIIAEFVRFHPLLENHTFVSSSTTVIKDRETVVIDLKKEYDSIWNEEYSSKNRNMIRKSLKLGYSSEIIVNPNSIELNSFIEIYLHSMKMAKAEDYYYFKKEYYESIFHKLPHNSYLINILNGEGKTVCSSIFFEFENYFHYHLSGRKQEADNSVNNFLISRAIEFSKSKGALYFHLGGGRSAQEDDSLFKFKKSFSKQKLSFYIGKKIHNKTVYENIVQQWEEKNPEKIAAYKHLILKYRF